MRRLAIAPVVGLLLVGGAVTAAAAGGRAPLQLGGMTEGGGSGRGMYRPDARFDLGVLVTNTSSSHLVLVDARVVAPPRTLVHQIGTRFHPWSPPKCPPNVAGCLVRGFPMTLRPNRPKPLALAPGKQAGLELDFQLGACSEIPSADASPLTHVRIAYRTADGTLHHRVLSLGRAAIRMRMPNAADCRDPHSSLTVAGPLAYRSGDSRAVPGSAGDVCSVRNGRLYFASRKYRTAGRRYERVTLQVGDYVVGRTGVFEKTTLKLVAAKKTVLRAHPAVRIATATNREILATVAAGAIPSVSRGRCVAA